MLDACSLGNDTKEQACAHMYIQKYLYLHTNIIQISAPRQTGSRFDLKI